MGKLITFPRQRTKRGVVWVQSSETDGGSWDVLFQSDSGEIVVLENHFALQGAIPGAERQAVALHAHLDVEGDQGGAA